ncbi:hypothetical protein M2101_001844 [Parabacteroides sp. PM5-20]|nr:MULTISPECIES: hypothetical protein [unclassified Parabacteroides]MDH6535166.1 hypothetical protein [Parabacteroides sp. PM5-20]
MGEKEINERLFSVCQQVIEEDKGSTACWLMKYFCLLIKRKG